MLLFYKIMMAAYMKEIIVEAIDYAVASVGGGGTKEGAKRGHRNFC